MAIIEHTRAHTHTHAIKHRSEWPIQTSVPPAQNVDMISHAVLYQRWAASVCAIVYVRLCVCAPGRIVDHALTVNPYILMYVSVGHAQVHATCTRAAEFLPDARSVERRFGGFFKDAPM